MVGLPWVKVQCVKLLKLSIYEKESQESCFVLVENDKSPQRSQFLEHQTEDRAGMLVFALMFIQVASV